MSKLYIVPTPIGNLKDITYRAVEVLNTVDVILAEDTRTSGKLLKHYHISTPMHSHHMHNEHKTVDLIVQKLLNGISIALISDAGTPAISDPGFLITRACISHQIPVECLPGATAFVPALVNSGLPIHKFTFEGFLPLKKGRQMALTNLSKENRTMVFYESPHKLVKTLSQFCTYFGPKRQASISRELSKLFEETLRGTLSELQEHFKHKTPKGEFVIVVAGKS